MKEKARVLRKFAPLFKQVFFETHRAFLGPENHEQRSQLEDGRGLETCHPVICVVNKTQIARCLSSEDIYLNGYLPTGRA